MLGEHQLSLIVYTTDGSTSCKYKFGWHIKKDVHPSILTVEVECKRVITNMLWQQLPNIIHSPVVITSCEKEYINFTLQGKYLTMQLVVNQPSTLCRTDLKLAG